MRISLWITAALVSGLVGTVAVAAEHTVAAAESGGVDTPLSPAVAQLVSAVLEANPRVQAARAAAQAAAARARAAGQPLYNPEVEIDAEQTESKTTSLGLRQAIDWTDKREARGNVASQEQMAAQAELRAVEQTLAGELLNGLAAYHTAAASNRLAQERVQLMQRFLSLTEARQRAGDVPQIELELARLAHTQAVLQQAQTAAQRTEAEQALVTVVGELPAEIPALPLRFPDIGTPDPQTFLAQLPELQAYQARSAAARATVSLRQREQRPDPTLRLRGGREASDPLVGLNLSIPLYVRNTYRAETQAAGAELLQAESTAQDALRRAHARFIAAAQRYRSTQQAWTAWEGAGAPSLGMQTALLERIWQAGELSTADYLVQLNQVLGTRATALDLRGQLWRSWIEWLAASGRLGNLQHTAF